MKTLDYVDEFKRYRKQLNDLVSQITWSKMIADNIADFISEEWEISTDNWGGDLKIKPKNGKITADKFDKLLTKLSKALNLEPKKYIEVDSLRAIFHVYRRNPDGYTDWARKIMIQVLANNSESCDITTENVVETVVHTSLTGYCKALAEKRYVNERIN